MNTKFNLFFFMMCIINSIKPEKLKIVTYLNNAYDDILKNFICNMRLLKLERNLHVYIADKKLIPLLSSLNISYKYIYSGKNADMLSNYGEKNYWNIAKKKLLAFLDAEEQYGDYVFTDVDVIWFKDPSNDLRLCKKNICFQRNSDLHPQNINSGFFYAKKSKFTRKFFKKALELSKHEKFQNKGSQAIIDYLLRRKFKNYKHVLALNLNKYPHGDHNGIWNLTLTEMISKYPNMYVLHNNWIVGKESKINRNKLTNTWFLNNSGECEIDKFQRFFK